MNERMHHVYYGNVLRSCRLLVAHVVGCSECSCSKSTTQTLKSCKAQAAYNATTMSHVNQCCSKCDRRVQSATRHCTDGKTTNSDTGANRQTIELLEWRVGGAYTEHDEAKNESERNLGCSNRRPTICCFGARTKAISTIMMHDPHNECCKNGAKKLHKRIKACFCCWHDPSST